MYYRYNSKANACSSANHLSEIEAADGRWVDAITGMFNNTNLSK